MITPWLFDIFNYPWSPDAAKFDIEGCQDFFDWHLESWELAERAGFEGVFFSEHHYTPYALSPSPNLLIAAIAQRTRRLKLGVPDAGLGQDLGERKPLVARKAGADCLQAGHRSAFPI